MKIPAADKMMHVALEEAKIAFENNEVPVGAALFDESGTCIAKSHNYVVREGDPTEHAELRVIKNTVRLLEKAHLNGYTLVVTLEPCAMCAQAIAWARVGKLIFGGYDSKSGGVINGARVFQQETCHHRPEIYGGIMEEECVELLRKFFQERR